MESETLNQRILVLLNSAKVGLTLSICAWLATFYRWVIIDGKTTVGFWPMAIAIPGLLALIYLGFHLMRRGSGPDRLVGCTLTWTFVLVGVAGALGY